MNKLTSFGTQKAAQVLSQTKFCLNFTNCCSLSTVARHELVKICSVFLTKMQKQQRLLLFFVFPLHTRQIILHNYQLNIIFGVMGFQQDLFFNVRTFAYKFCSLFQSVINFLWERCVVNWWGVKSSAWCLPCVS